MMTINVADDGGADTDDDNNYKYCSILEQQCRHSRRIPQRELKFKKVGFLDDCSELSDEIADLCKKLPIC